MVEPKVPFMKSGKQGLVKINNCELTSKLPPSHVQHSLEKIAGGVTGEGSLPKCGCNEMNICLLLSCLDHKLQLDGKKLHTYKYILSSHLFRIYYDLTPSVAYNRVAELVETGQTMFWYVAIEKNQQRKNSTSDITEAIIAIIMVFVSILCYENTLSVFMH